MLSSSLLSPTQSHAQSTPVLLTLNSMWRRAAPCITEPNIMVLWRSSMANLLVRSLATRPTWVWWLSLLPQWVAMCTVLMSRSGSSMQNPLHHLQQAGGQGEEEPLQPGEGKVRRETRRGKRTKSHAPTQPASSLSTWLVYHYCTIIRSIHSIPGLHSINTISQYMFR